MKSFIFILVALIANSGFALEAIPSGTLPVAGEITIRYTPKFESRCVSKTYERKNNEFFGTNSSQVGEFSVFEESPGVVKLSLNTQMGAANLRLTIELNEDRSGFSLKEPEFQTDIQMSPDDERHLPQMKALLFKTMKAGLGAGIGVPLRQGSNTLMELCEFVPGVRQKSQSGNHSVIGTALIKGRESVIFSGEQYAECVVQESQGMLREGDLLKFQIGGWQAIDRQSGLPAGNSLVSLMTFGGGSMTSTDDKECQITGASSLASQGANSTSAGVRNPEQRLFELKSLLDKGLITQENFEKKRAEILDAL